MNFLTARRIVGALVVVGFLVALAPMSVAVQPDKVRDFRDCMQSANAMKDICDAACFENCGSDDACLDPCLTSCARLMQGLKGTCKFEFTGKEPNLP